MTAPGFAELVTRLMAAMGQQMDAVREIPEGLLLRTGDGFLFAFLPDPTVISLATVQGFRKEVADTPARLVLLTPGHLPLALTAEVLQGRGTVVDGGRFHELVRSLGLGSYLGEEPRPERPGPSPRLLPSAQQLDEVMRRAKTWLDWGVPALGLRFYRQAAAMKPEFAPARVGIGRSLLSLGLVDDAERSFAEVLAAHPGDIDARLGEAAVLGARGQVHKEIERYRALLGENPARVDVRSHLVAALIAQAEWGNARDELRTLLEGAPDDPPLRYLYGVALEHSGGARAGAEERAAARRLGLDADRERALCEHLGIPAPPPPKETPAPAPRPSKRRAPARPRGRAGPKPVRPSRPSPARARGRKTK